MDKQELLRMTEGQLRAAKGLIRNLCCNYDSATGCCLPLDTPCPQMITQSMICKWFRNALLEDPDGQPLKAQIFHDESVKLCESCGQPFHANSNRSKYCSKCAAEAKRKQARYRKRKQREKQG